jgi:surfactin synthase thioesterase subunit
VQLLAPQLPGRGQRLREPPLTSCQAVAQELLPVVAPLLQSGQPWVVVGHSMGCWAAYELLLAALRHGEWH